MWTNTCCRKLSQKSYKTYAKKASAEWLVEVYAVNKRRACRLMPLCWSSYNYQPVKKDERALILRIRDLAAAHLRYGYRRITVLLKREGWSVGKKRVYCIYKAEGLEVRTKKGKKRAAQRQVSLPTASVAQERWSTAAYCAFSPLSIRIPKLAHRLWPIHPSMDTKSLQHW